MIRQVLAAALIVLVALGLLIVAWPQLFGLEKASLVAQAVSFRGLAAVGAVTGAVGLGVIGLVSLGARRLAASIAVLLLVFAAVNLAVLNERGFGGAELGQESADELTVLAWNTQGDEPGAAAIAQLALETSADVIALPETTAETGLQVAALMTEAGQPMEAHTTSYDESFAAQATTLLISTALGSYFIDESIGNTGQLPTVVARPETGTGPSFAAVHPIAPVPRRVDDWRTDLEWLAGVCEGNMVMAGDFNATLDHFSSFPASDEADFGECRDAALQAGAAAVGTWPSAVPALLSTPIDHVLVTEQWRVTAAQVVSELDGLGSDHRPVIARVAPAG